MKTIMFFLSALCLVSGIHADDSAPAEQTSEEVSVVSEETVEASEEVSQAGNEIISTDQDNTYSCHCHKKGK